MKRNYTHVKIVGKEILKMKDLGKSNRQIAEHFGFKDKCVVKEWVKRYNRAQRNLAAGILPKIKGRKPKNNITSDQKKDNEIKRLKMENELLRDFLYLVGRR